MKDQDKTKEQLLDEFAELHKRILELDITETKCKMALEIIGRDEYNDENSKNTEEMNSLANMIAMEATRWE